jgi:hypothetical protein
MSSPDFSLSVNDAFNTDNGVIGKENVAIGGGFCPREQLPFDLYTKCIRDYTYPLAVTAPATGTAEMTPRSVERSRSSGVLRFVYSLM